VHPAKATESAKNDTRSNGRYFLRSI